MQEQVPNALWLPVEAKTFLEQIKRSLAIDLLRLNADQGKPTEAPRIASRISVQKHGQDHVAAKFISQW